MDVRFLVRLVESERFLRLSWFLPVKVLLLRPLVVLDPLPLRRQNVRPPCQIR